MKKDSGKLSENKLNSQQSLELKKSPGRSTSLFLNTNYIKFDNLVAQYNQASFYNYDIDKKLYTELEMFLKMMLYRNHEIILSKISFDRPGFERIISFEEKINYNICKISQVKQPEEEENIDIDTTDIASMNLFKQSQSINLNDVLKTQVKIFFFG